MSTITISSLPEALSVADASNIPMETSNVTKHITAANLKAYATADVNANVTAANAAIATTNTAIVTANTAVVAYVNTLNAIMDGNVKAANAAIITANTGMKSYVDTVITNWTSNATSQESEITGLRANVIASNAAIVTANTAMKSYVDAVTTAWIANAAGQANQITAANTAIVTANTAMQSYVDAVTTAWTANAVSQNTLIVSLQGNAASQATDINGLGANITAANAAIVTANTAMQGYVDAVTNAWTANASTQQGLIDTLTSDSYGPAVSAYQDTRQNAPASPATLKLTFGTSEYDTDSCFNGTTFTPTKAGRYHIISACQLTTTDSSTLAPALRIFKNNSLYRAGGYTGYNVSNPQVVASSYVYLNGTTDYVEINLATNTSSGNVFTSNTQAGTYFQAMWIRP